MSNTLNSHVANNDDTVSSVSSYSLPKSSSSSRLEHLQSPSNGGKHRPSAAMAAAAPPPASPRFFNNFCSLSHLPSSLLAHYSTARAELDAFDSLMLRKASDMQHKLDGIDVVVGIPFYTEITNIISVLVTLKEVFQQRRQRACLLVIGEFSRSDMVESIPLHQLEDAEDGEDDGDDGRPAAYVHIESFWKPHPKYASKPFTVRALQVLADRANGGHGAHLIIMDADIQFNHWELSAMSLMRALLDPLMQLKGKKEDGTEFSNPLAAHSPQVAARPPLASAATPRLPAPVPSPVMSQPRSDSRPAPSPFHPQFPLRDLERPPAASFVLLNAPRSFIADDALIHLFSYLMTYSFTGQHIHQSHGGEFSIHRQLNRSLLADESIVYRNCYCVEQQMVCRALLEEQVELTGAAPAAGGGSPTADGDGQAAGGGGAGSDGVQEYGGYVLEMLMKGKWHAKINLNKLLQLDAGNAARLDLVTEKLFTDSVLFASLSLTSTPGIVHLRTGGLTKTLNPDPQQQSMKVLCPVATKKEMLLMIKSYYVLLLAQQSDGSLPIDSAIVQELIPMLHSKLAKLPGEKGWNNVLNGARAAAARSDSAKVLLFGAEEWSRYTMEVLRIYLHAWSAPSLSEAERVKAAKQKAACISANRIIWLLGALAFLNEHSTQSWGAMHDSMHRVYAPKFRLRFLTEIMGVNPAAARDIVEAETGKQQN